MSNHLRHCPKHRKPLPCVHCALAAKSASSVTVPAVAEPAPRRGRPPKFGTAMSPAEQKRRKRAEKQQEQEQRDLIAQLMKIYRCMQPSPYSKLTHPAERDAEIRRAGENIRERQRRFLEGLEELQVDDLKRLLEAWTTIPDSHGRLHNERSGEKPRYKGQSEIEILAAHAVREGDGGRVTPGGYGPVNDDGDGKTQRNASTFAGHERRPIKREAKPSALDNRLYLIARWLMRTGTCSVCGFAGGDEHIWQKWYESVWKEQRWEAAHSAQMGIYVYEELGQEDEHLPEIRKYLRKPLTFFRSVDDQNPSGEVTLVEIEDSIRRGWTFFSTVSNRTEYLLPSQAIVQVFFGHLRFSDSFCAKA
jgi:hypothetical protein